ncbi:MAG TPA: hypothetical protein PLP29_08490 [Candidatus Ozemobacteraceae bacterium]|nr:hypothetical protein [Candidatus Ozemobacteraceae bacterium]
MKRFIGRALIAMTAALALCPVVGTAAVEDELKYLGYSDELASFAVDSYDRTHKKPAPTPEEAAKTPTILDEADAVKEQLTELGRTRSLTPETPVTSEESKTKLDSFWKQMNAGRTETVAPLSEELRGRLKEALMQALTGAGYELKQLDLVDTPANLGNPQVRAVVRVIKPVTSKDSYREIQNNLAQIKDMCLQAGTIDNVQYLSELTTFIAINPRNKYYYEKTVLNP